MTRKRKSFHNPHTTFSSLAGRRRYYSPFKKENAPPKKYRQAIITSIIHNATTVG